MQDNIVIKSSGNTIKLESTPEEVTGGYFDSQEVWHEFGEESSESSEFVHVTIKVIGDVLDFEIRNILFNTETTEPYSAYPETFDLNATLGDMFLSTENSETTVLVPKNIPFSGIGESVVETIEGTAKYDLDEDYYIFYADGDNQTLTITFKDVT